MIQDFYGFTPRIDPCAWVHEAAVVIGDVRIGPGSGIWPCAVLRGDMGPITVGCDSNLQDGVICHDTGDVSATVVGDRVTVGHRAILHGCRIANDCLVGMGAIVLDNAVIGERCLVAAGALVTANQTFDPGMLILGSPARAVRPLRDHEFQWIDHSWRVYKQRAEQWRASTRHEDS